MPETEETTRFWFSKLPKKEDLEFLNRFHPVLKARGEDFPTRDQGQEPYGQLTEKGLMEHRALGASLRRHTLAHGLLPARLGEEEEEGEEGGGGGVPLVAARSTNIRRTIQSAQSLLLGLYPLEARAPGALLLPVAVRPIEEEAMIPNADRSCRRQLELIRELDAAGNQLPRDLREGGLEARVREIFGLGAGRKVVWTAAREVLVCHHQHGFPLPLPPGVDAGLVGEVLRASVAVWTSWFAHPEFNRLAMGPFLTELLAALLPSSPAAAAAGGGEGGRRRRGRPGDRPRLALFSAHDNTLVPLLVALGAYDGELPPYAALLTLEVAADRATGERFVRVVYNHREVAAPVGTPLDRQEGIWVPLESFRAQLAQRIPGRTMGSKLDKGDEIPATKDELSASVA